MPKSRLEGNALYAVLLTLLLTLAGIMLFANLEGMYVELYDEARHAVNAYEMIQNDNYLVNTYWGAPDYSNLKPPLSMWSIVLGYKLFGYTLAAIRIPSAASMLLMMLAVAVWMKRRFGSVASLSALGALMAMEAVIAGHYARYADPDALYQLVFYHFYALYAG